MVKSDDLWAEILESLKREFFRVVGSVTYGSEFRATLSTAYCIFKNQQNSFILSKETLCQEKNIVIFDFSFICYYISAKCFGNSIPIIKRFNFG